MKIIPPETLLNAYAQGVFPMADSRESEGINWYSASERGVIPISRFHISKNVLKLIQKGKFEVHIDRDFRKVVQECANRETTWINDLIVNSYDVLNQAGYAHSVEVYLDKKLVGGLYGVHLKSAFFGESMFKKVPEADKVALYHCHQILEKNRFLLWDTQFYTEHLSRFGCIEVDSTEYDQMLERALSKNAEFIFG